MRRKLPKFLDRFHILHDRAGRPRSGHTKRVRMQKERKANIEHRKFRRMMEGAKSMTLEEFAEHLKDRIKKP